MIRSCGNVGYTRIPSNSLGQSSFTNREDTQIVESEAQLILQMYDLNLCRHYWYICDLASSAAAHFRAPARPLLKSTFSAYHGT